jgi:hypothetical protein
VGEKFVALNSDDELIEPLRRCEPRLGLPVSMRQPSKIVLYHYNQLGSPLFPATLLGSRVSVMYLRTRDLK